jgi:hypothetical protein
MTSCFYENDEAGKNKDRTCYKACITFDMHGQSEQQDMTWRLRRVRLKRRTRARRAPSP